MQEDLKKAVIQAVGTLMEQGLTFEEAKKKLTEDLEKSLFSEGSARKEEKS